jgi:uncharacterized protein YbgA (DUF1722 family)/uncharacterized protein YbbK (DUF523 family)
VSALRVVLGVSQCEVLAIMGKGKHDCNKMAAVTKPVVVVSQCLGFAAVRYNGAMLQDDFVRALTDHVRFVQVCPEVGIGLGVPRDPIRLVASGADQRLVQPASGRDLTGEMQKYSKDFLGSLGPVDGFILKSRSPSCGIKDVKVHATADGPATVGKSSGLFAAAVFERFPAAAIEDDGRLTNANLRHHFLVRVFASARLREVMEGGGLANLVRFHTQHKLQLMAYSQSGLKALGRIVANAESLPAPEVLSRYSERFGQVVAMPARPSSNRNVLLHAFGYVSDRLGARERQHFLKLLEDYRAMRLPLSALLSLVQSWIVRFDELYLADQTFFEPYPRPLLNLTDSGSGTNQETRSRGRNG